MMQFLDQWGYRVAFAILLALFITSAFGQGGRDLVPPKFQLTYEGQKVDHGRGIYVPHAGLFGLQLINQEEVESNLPTGAYLAFVASEAVVTRQNREVVSDAFNPHQFLNQNFDLLPVLSRARTNDNLSLRVRYLYVTDKREKVRVIESGTTEMNIPLK